MRVSADGRTLTVAADDGAAVDFNRFWLRDQCPTLPSKASGLRTWSVATVGADLAIAGAEAPGGDTVQVDWSDGHRSEFKVAELFELAPQAQGLRWPLTEAELFTGADEPPVFAADLLDPGSVTHHDLIDAVDRHGLALVRDLPDDDGATEGLAELLGQIRHTDFGRVFDIVTEPEAWTLSQSNQGQDPHTDDPFRYNPSGISILHCRAAAEGSGGVSIVADGFAIAEDVRAHDPAAFDLLRTVPIPFIRQRAEAVDQGEDVNMVAYGPVITTDGDGPDAPLTGIRFHERSTGVFDLDPSVVDAYYLAYRGFAERVRSDHFQVRYRLGPGEAFVFDNQRVLHGRTGYQDDTAGRRHIRLCTVDRDQVHSRLRRLKEVHGLGGLNRRTRSGPGLG